MINKQLSEIITDIIEILNNDYETLRFHYRSDKATYKRAIILIKEYAKRNGAGGV